jgi:HCOMODA/2-hydroxy-3-carboxy-muconic semialdehyde decarboxylase
LKKAKISASKSVVDDVVAASRVLAQQGVLDAYGHVSARSDKRPDRFVMSRSRAPALVTAADIMEHDADSEPVGDERKGFLERFIHGEIYRARPEVMAVVHSHSPSVIPFGLVRVPLQAMFHSAAFIASGVPVFDIRKKFGATDMLVSNREKGGALVSVLGAGDIVLMRAHGSVACGRTLQTAVFRAVYMEINARIQHWTVALARNAVEPDIAALTAEEGRLADVPNQTAGMRAWDLWRNQVRAQTNW